MKNDTLGLYGPEDSKYLRLVARRAEAEGIKTAWVAGPTPGCVAYVADTDAGWPLWDLSPEEDVDRIQHPGLSCCAAAPPDAGGTEDVRAGLCGTQSHKSRSRAVGGPEPG